MPWPPTCAASTMPPHYTGPDCSGWGSVGKTSQVAALKDAPFTGGCISLAAKGRLLGPSEWLGVPVHGLTAVTGACRSP
jgi:hypothetical protein